jgi:hypothetical protein
MWIVHEVVGDTFDHNPIGVGGKELHRFPLDLM